MNANRLPLEQVRRAGLLVAFATALLGAAISRADDRPSSLTKRASWKLPDVDNVREQVQRWVSEDGADKSSLAAAEELWQAGAADESAEPLLDLVCQTLVLGEPRAKELVEVGSQPRKSIALPDVGWLNDEATPAFVRGNLRLFYARWLVQELLFDEAAEQLKGLKTADVCDPAALLFYQAVASHRTLARDEGLTSIARLLENEASIPKRYVSLAKLMQADLEGLKDDSLDHIARRMDDIRRRLDLGRAGPKVREVEDGVIASLDKLIEELEKQAQASSSSSSSGQGGGQQSPQDDSSPQGANGGRIQEKVTGKPEKQGEGWSELPPKQRDEALQQIGQDFPAHYRDMIEQYFRKLATQDEGEKP
jgi:hypothetical protein